LDFDLYNELILINFSYAGYDQRFVGFTLIQHKITENSSSTKILLLISG